jgi:uncharacterized protein YqeY
MIGVAMSLKDRLTEDLKQAMRQGDERRKSTIRLVRADITNAEIERGEELGDDKVLAIIAKQAKQRRESVAEFARAGRQDLVDQEEEELEILLSYLPAQMSRDEIEVVARQVIAEVGATSLAQMGEVMRRLMSQVKGKPVRQRHLSLCSTGESRDWSDEVGCQIGCVGAPQALLLFEIGNVQFLGRGQGYRALRSNS